MAHRFGHVAAARRWALGAAALTTALAIFDAFASGVVLTGILVLGPLLAAARCGPRATAALSGYAVLLGLLGGLPNDIFLEGEHLTRLFALAIGALVAVWIAALRTRGERTNDHLLAQNALAVSLVESGSIAEATPKALESIGRTLGWQLGTLWTLDESRQGLRVAGVWQEPGLEAAGFVGLSRRKTFAPRRRAARASPGSATSRSGARTSRRTRATPASRSRARPAFRRRWRSPSSARRASSAPSSSTRARYERHIPSCFGCSAASAASSASTSSSSTWRRQPARARRSRRRSSRPRSTR